MSESASGLLTPFRRDKKRDFASGSGEDLLASKVRLALLTEGATPRYSGELPWRTAFGSGLHLLRHLRNDAALSDLARVYVRDCLARWVPEAELVEVVATRDGAVLQVGVRFRSAKGGGDAATTKEVRISVKY